jgi:CRISPR/Cas system endoribonuclease Cas6 (RAMP superfamily)
MRDGNIRWRDWERYSARQDTRMKMGGFVGKVNYRGDVGEFLPLLRLGEILHLGKGTGFGLGRYEIAPRSW